jgi:guanyl-specific ribonuclease Sa
MQYIVYRLGWSDANQKPKQGLPEKMAVMRVEAANAEEACSLAASQVSLSASQRLTAEPADTEDNQEVSRNLRVEALPRESNEIGGST